MKKLIFSAAIIATLLLGACEQSANYSPQDILEEALQETISLDSYYGEYTISMGDGTNITAKQWVKDGRIRIEANDAENGEDNITTNDGAVVTSYTPSTNSGFIFNIGDTSDGFTQPTLQEQALSTLKMIQDSHDISSGADEKIAGRDTYHLVAKAKTDNALIGDMDVWIDKKTWMILKSVSVSGDVMVSSQYTTFEENPTIDEALFTIDVPADADMIIQEIQLPEQLTLEQAEEKLGDFLQMPASSGYEISAIEDMNMTDTNEIVIAYEKEGVLQFNLSVFQPQNEFSMEDEIIAIRGQQGTKLEMSQFRLIQWEEDGLRYNALIENPDLTTDDMIALLEQLQ